VLPTRDRWHSAIALGCRVLHPLGIHMQHCTGRSVPALTSFSEDASMCSFEIQNAAGRAYVYIYTRSFGECSGVFSERLRPGFFAGFGNAIGIKMIRVNLEETGS